MFLPCTFKKIGHWQHFFVSWWRLHTQEAMDHEMNHGEAQYQKMQALEQRNDTMQLVLLVVILVSLSFVLSSLLPYALVFFLGVICGRTGFASLVRHSIEGTYKVANMLFLKKSGDSKGAIAVAPKNVLNDNSKTIQAPNETQMIHYRPARSSSSSRKSGGRRRSSRHESDSSSDSSSEEELQLDISRSSRARQRRAQGRVDLGQIMTTIGSQVLNQWISNEND